MEKYGGTKAMLFHCVEIVGYMKYSGPSLIWPSVIRNTQLFGLAENSAGYEIHILMNASRGPISF